MSTETTKYFFILCVYVYDLLGGLLFQSLTEEVYFEEI